MSSNVQFFKPGDFGTGNNMQKESAAFYANLKLQKLIDESPVVYGYGEQAGASSLWNMNGPEKERFPHTHKAVLFNIQELPKPECKHEPSPLESYNGSFVNIKSPFCKYCGIELQAEWKAKGGIG